MTSKSQSCETVSSFEKKTSTKSKSMQIYIRKKKRQNHMVVQDWRGCVSFWKCWVLASFLLKLGLWILEHSPTWLWDGKIVRISGGNIASGGSWARNLSPCERRKKETSTQRWYTVRPVKCGISKDLILGGGNSNIFYVHSYLGKWSNFD